MEFYHKFLIAYSSIVIVKPKFVEEIYYDAEFEKYRML